MNMHINGRIAYGDKVRLYGFPGLFEVSHTSSKLHDFYATPIDGAGLPRNSGWPASDASVVEINGQPVPLLSAPLVPPSDDYPHTPTFDYSDGPQSLAESAIALWHN
jgi:hypothetical protein